MGAILAMAEKDLRLLARDKTAALFTFAVPILFGLFFGVLFSGSGGGSAIRLAVVDEDGSDLSGRFTSRLASSDALEVHRMDRGAAADWVRRGDGTAYLVLPDGFGAAVPNILLGERARLELGVDPARRAEAGMLEGILNRYFFESLAALASQPDVLIPYVQRAELTALAGTGLGGLGPSGRSLVDLLGSLEGFLSASRDRAAAASEGPAAGSGSGSGEATASGGWTPLQIDSVAIAPDRIVPANAFEISFPQGLLWGLMACAATFATSLVSERSRGTLIRLRSAPIGRMHILVGKALACFAASLVMLATILAIGAVGFGVRPDSLGLLAVAAVAAAFAFTGLMMLMSLIGHTERATSAVGWAAMMVLAMFGGGMMPLFFMPDWMQRVSDVSPVKWAILALEGAIWRGFGAAEMALPVGVLLAIGGVSLVLGLKLFRVSQQGS